ncbi:AAA family ATPase [Xanthovirga aplysinae]|uniref:ParA family protein n=1 Tax=Xanthovirga aplysinae TaxID=2529853 RepID=UPI001656C09A|nr:hypothetical protein [Xanthovirga aplysinae]
MNYCRIISIFNHKGGVGKTRTAINLGKTLPFTNRVLLIDMDSQGNLSQSFGVYHPKSQVVDILIQSGKLNTL